MQITQQQAVIRVMSQRWLSLVTLNWQSVQKGEELSEICCQFSTSSALYQQSSAPQELSSP